SGLELARCSASQTSSPPHLFGARNGIFRRRDCGPKSAVCPSGERETQRTHWKSPPLVGIFGASPHVGRKTVAELCDFYLADAEAGRLVTRRRTQKKANTLAIDRGRIARHIKPMLGQLRVAAVTREDVECFMHDVTEGKTAANTRTKPRGLARVRGG